MVVPILGVRKILLEGCLELLLKDEHDEREYIRSKLLHERRKVGCVQDQFQTVGTGAKGGTGLKVSDSQLFERYRWM